MDESADRCLVDCVQLVVQVAYCNGYRVGMEDAKQIANGDGADVPACTHAALDRGLDEARRFEQQLRRQLSEQHGMTMHPGAELRRPASCSRPAPPAQAVICRSCGLPWGDGWIMCSCGCASTRRVSTAEALEALEGMCRARLPDRLWSAFVAQLEVD